MVEKGAGGFANKGDDGERKSSSRRTTTQRLLGSATRVTTTATCSKTKNNSAMHLKQFSRPKVTFYEGSLGDDEARDEKEPKDHADGRNIASSSHHGKQRTIDSPALPLAKSTTPLEDKSDNVGNGKRDRDDERVCRYGKACFNRNAQHLRNFKHPPATTRRPAVSSDEDNASIAPQQRGLAPRYLGVPGKRQNPKTAWRIPQAIWWTVIILGHHNQIEAAQRRQADALVEIATVLRDAFVGGQQPRRTQGDS
ncbi:hypothetical protein HPB52_010553 [Rhipicephalus sanguineus]|uniref:PBZ-type domain-containing protein n=1 Tax=Rhipicephalus sanguineus TaxID=34632 RepID=A0A9D4PZE1_RHISA|nr:hypothetical protein HPB52_010553 [Rhipicephalus sanguineus]